MLQIKEGYKGLFGNSLFKAVNLQINDGEKIGIVGRNGTGKSTLLHLLAKVEQLDSGDLFISKQQRVSLLEQQLDVTSDETLWDYIYEGQSLLRKLGEDLKKLEYEMAQTVSPEELETLLAAYSKRQEQFILAGGYELEEQMTGIAKGLGIDSLLYQKMTALSGGQQTLGKLARILVEKADILLLDEPTNHLDSKGLEWLENYLKHTKQTVVLVSHDRYFLDQVVNRIVLISQQEVTSYQGNYTHFSKTRALELLQLERQLKEQLKERQQMDQAIRRFRHWGANGDNEKFFKKAKQLEKKKDSMALISVPSKHTGLENMTGFTSSRRSGKDVLVINGVWKSYGNHAVFEEASCRLYRNERVALLGNNGSGKTTLIRLILNEEVLDGGHIRLGASIHLGYLPQMIVFSDETQTILSYVRETCALEEQQARELLVTFLFTQDHVQKRLGFLSGGEKMRLKLACLLQKEVNFLILDEPTNHLDLETREWLEMILLEFKGTMLLISHDRYFLKTLTTKTLRIENKTLIES